MGMTANPTDDRQIPGVHGQIPGVHRQITGVDNTPLRVTPNTENDAHDIRENPATPYLSTDTSRNRRK